MNIITLRDASTTPKPQPFALIAGNELDKALTYIGKSNFIRSSGTPTKFSEDEFPKITVIVACKDAASTITRTLSSIEAQDYANIQVIVIDGGSSDQTHNIIEEFRHIVDVYISGKDKGVADAHNIALLHATGDLITFLNADDFKLPGCFYFVAE